MARLQFNTILLAAFCMAAICLSACGAADHSASATAATPVMKSETAKTATASSWDDPAESVAPAPSLAAAAPDTVEGRLARLEKEVSDLHNDMNMMMPALTKLVNAQQDLQDILSRMETAAGNAPAPIADTAADAAAMPGVAKPETASAEAQDKIASLDAKAQPLTLAPQPAAAAVGDAADEIVSIDAPKPEAAIPLTHNEVPPPGQGAPAGASMEASVTPNATSGADSLTQAQVSEAPPAAEASATPAAFSISQVRFGEHNKRTRMVLEANGKVPYNYQIDASGTLLTLHLPQTDWKATQVAPSATAVVESYTATPDGQGGSMVSVKLKKPTSVSWADLLPPSGKDGYRVVLDLTPKA